MAVTEADSEADSAPSFASAASSEQAFLASDGTRVECQSASPRRQSLPYFPALDGIRGAAVAAVLAFHAGFSWAVGGYLGVSTFFTLSGFLITSLLLAEHRSTGHIDLRAFWTRRFRRLMPAALATLALVALFGWLLADETQRRNLAGDVGAALAYVANWRFVLSGKSYGELFSAPSPVQHFWSLAIEEQFYLLYPLLVFWLGRLTGFSRRWFAWLLTALLAASVSLSVIGGLSIDRIYYGTDTRAAELLVGALLALLIDRRRIAGRIAASVRLQWVLAALASVALVGCVILWATQEQQTSGWLYHGGFSAYALLSALIILGAVIPTGPVRWLLARRPLRNLGVVSYGVYLYHWPVFNTLTSARTGLRDWPLFALRLTTTLLIAIASYRFLEQPIRRGQSVVGVRPLAVAPLVAGAITLAVIAASFTAPAPTIDFAAVERKLAATTNNAEAPLPADDSGSNAPPRARIAVFGDSTAMLTGFGLAGYAQASGKADVVSGWTGLGCGLSRYGNRGEGPSRGPVLPECNAWDEGWREAIDKNRPNIGVIQVGPWEVVDRQLPGDRWRALGDPVLDEYEKSEIRRAIDLLQAVDAEVVFLNLPYIGAPEGKDVTEFRGNAADPARADRFNQLLAEVAAERPGVHIIDLKGWLESSGEDKRLRPDGEHFSEATAYEVAERFLLDAILAIHEQAWRARQEDSIDR
ncbi:MAG: acyltransferase family protein [Acidimicrobiales bacterium]|nr:acyltransferase family protein [Acidimicrobiales bacterium]